ncbi:glycosyltransferase [Natronorarus salvus]|uniref:glycosyltransferase n=1 Tax=Natronorarus salvus TaxID=3117733 RepID=UPI002F268ED0
MSPEPAASHTAHGDDPLVSVVVPTYDRASVLPRAIESVLAQTHGGLELLICDDGSTDDTESVVADYDDDRIRYLPGENRGANAARNRGIRAAMGDLVSFLDSDDEYHPERLARTVDALSGEPSACAGAFTSYWKVRDGEPSDLIRARDGRVTRRDIARANVVGGFSCTTFRRAVFDRVGLLREDLASSQDYEFFLRVFREHYMVGIPAILVTCHGHGGQISADIERKLAGQRTILEEYGDEITDARRAQHHYMRGQLYADAGRMGEAARAFAEAVRIDPRAWRYYYYALAARLGRRPYRTATGLKNRVKVALHRVRT